MALSLSLTSTSYALLELTSWPSHKSRRVRLCSSKIVPFRTSKPARLLRIRAVRDTPVINGVESATLNGNENGSVDQYLGNGNEASNGSMVKYVNGNGNGVAAEVVVETVVMETSKEKRTIEEIGQEEAWFKKDGAEGLEVSVAPGGRWSRFKTYSTIQRTLEIWGFVLTFVFKAWLNNQKFSYKGGMTEEKKRLRRIDLAKWLKENILRLGPTFIKLGQQFSTRVDILAQEYVDQLSELQDQVPPFPSETAVAIVEEELGAPLADIFEHFDYEPMAAASLGQVHRARVKGQEVVVKVQRPGLKDLFDIDLKNLRVSILISNPAWNTFCGKD
ncbi:hypothetical protein Cgig2_026143 [Carnegiea gigantea]|uniref:ABC1 atypical kinase-like domain-containing protein n=1 Tax=Carnegiea gigantea TaxID=171969 RepID=A0A9Q1JXQ4_9CARY|nr:hypothetical protein Cgig2_026143 [Carnegiea gigantea]